MGHLMADRAKRLPPWREITYFQLPTVSAAGPPPVNGWALIVTGNPNRVALILSSPSASVVVSPDSTLPAGTGIALSGSTATLIITEAQLGPLCTGPWYLSGIGGSGNGTVTAIEVVLREWPQPSF